MLYMILASISLCIYLQNVERRQSHTTHQYINSTSSLVAVVRGGASIFMMGCASRLKKVECRTFVNCHQQSTSKGYYGSNHFGLTPNLRKSQTLQPIYGLSKSKFHIILHHHLFGKLFSIHHVCVYFYIQLIMYIYELKN